MPTKDMTLEELKDTLVKNGRRHRWYFHYTASTVLGNMLKSNQLRLSSLERMNDGKEAKLRMAKSTFAACFSYGSCLRVTRWAMGGTRRHRHLNEITLPPQLAPFPRLGAEGGG